MNKITVSIAAIVLVIIMGVFFWMQTPKQKVSTEKVSSSVVGVTDTEILLGSSSALSGSAARLGIDLLSGAQAAIKEINDSGGINGRMLRVISYDDQYDPPKAVENTQRLINEDKVFALFNYVGTPTGVKVVPVVAEAKIPLVGMFTGAHAFRDPLQEYIFNIRGSYYQETELAVRYFVDDLGFKDIAVLYQADAFGLDGFDGVKIALDKRGLKPVEVGSYERATTNVEAAVQTITASRAQAVIMIGTYSPLAKFVKLTKKQKPNMLFDTVSFVGSEAFVKELGADTVNVYVTEVVPPHYYGDLFDGVREYIKNLTKYEPETEPTFGGLEGYINTKVLAEGIRLAGKDLTREGLLTALENMQNYDVGIGATVSFSATEHQGLDKVYLTYFNRDKDKFELVPVK